MDNKEIRNQINDIIEGEIQNGINEYLESEEGKKDNALGFVEGDAKKLNVRVYKDEVDKLIKEYKKIKKARKSNLGQVKLIDKHGKPLK